MTDFRQCLLMLTVHTISYMELDESNGRIQSKSSDDCDDE